MQTQGNNFGGIKNRFEKDAKSFSDIYSKDSGFNSWFNQTFRKPIFERFEVAMQVAGDLKNKSVLDIGCGPGVYVVSYAARGAQHVLGLDLSQSMIEIAKRRVQERGMSEVCELKTANFLDIRSEKQFHFSLAMGVFDYLAEPIPFLKKMKDVTIEKITASFPGNSFIRGPLRKLRYLLTGKGTVYFYTRRDVERLANIVGFSHYEIIPVKSGSGFILVAQP